MQTLNVILHGLFALAEKEDHILAMAPDLGGQHVFRAGSWLGESELQRGIYWLSGVNAGPGVFDPARNLILENKTVSAQAPSKAYATICFRRPREIHSVRPVTIDPAKDFTGGDAGSVRSTQLATIQILVYDCENLSAVRLSGHTWEPPQDDETPVFNLHIFSEEDVKPDESHAIGAFDQAVALFEGVDLHLTKKRDVPEFDVAKEVLPNGVIPLEIEDLAYRRNRLVDLGNTLRSILLSPPLDFSPLMDVLGDAIPTSGDIDTCSFPVVRQG